jgi:CspA family cold shock protein
MSRFEVLGPIRGVVRTFDREGIGVIDAPEVPGGCFVHFSTIDGSGIRELVEGEIVDFTCEKLDFLQDGYQFRAVSVHRSN